MFLGSGKIVVTTLIFIVTINKKKGFIPMSNESKAVRVYKRTSEKAGCYYTNIVSNPVTLFGFKARYQQGANTTGEKQHIWFLNDSEVDYTGLPEKAWGYIGGDLVDDKEYQKRSTASQPVESNENQESSSAPF